MKTYFKLLVFIISFNFSYGQYDWTDAEVYLKNGNVLNGEAKLTMMAAAMNLSTEKLKFRTKDKKNKSKYTPEDIEYVVFTINPNNRDKKNRVRTSRTEKYIPVYLNKNQTKLGFVELLVDGELRLVARTVSVNSGGGWTQTGAPGSAPTYTPGFMGSHNQVMFLKEGEKPEVFNDANIFKSFRKRAMDYFEDCPSLVNKLEKKEFVDDDLREIVKYYNSTCN
jgi:hypothetical protein